jgi:hypothetical protein
MIERFELAFLESEEAGEEVWGIVDNQRYRFAPYGTDERSKSWALDGLREMDTLSDEHLDMAFQWESIPDEPLLVPDMVNHPPHYTSNGIEVIDVIEAFSLGNARIANVIKYVLRHEHKNGTEDLKKALWYLQREVNAREEAGV